MENSNWYTLNNPDSVVSPTLLVYPERIMHNIKEMLRMVGDPKMLRTHIKTHKTAEIIKMQQEVGINKFKCATPVEAELLGKCNAEDILLAMQPAGPNIDWFLDLIERYPHSKFSCLVDNESSVEVISRKAGQRGFKIDVFMDINNGMNRTGIEPNDNATKLFQTIHNNEFLNPRGLHVYDGHIRVENFEERKAACDMDFQKLLDLKSKIEATGIKVETIIAGGSPTFPIHSQRPDVEASPGTTLLWDENFGSKFKEMKFKQAAVLVTRIISKPNSERLCLDLGHKSIASEMNFPRLKFLNTTDFEQIGQSEEHLVVSSSNSEKYKVGDLFYAVPMHVCPTVSKYPELEVVKDGAIIERWKVAARDHNSLA